MRNIDTDKSNIASGTLKDKHDNLIAQVFTCRYCGACITVMPSVLADYDILPDLGGKYAMDNIVDCCSRPSYYYHNLYRGNNEED
jgi:hypothetical protein